MDCRWQKKAKEPMDCLWRKKGVHKQSKLHSKLCTVKENIAESQGKAKLFELAQEIC